MLSPYDQHRKSQVTDPSFTTVASKITSHDHRHLESNLCRTQVKPRNKSTLSETEESTELQKRRRTNGPTSSSITNRRSERQPKSDPCQNVSVGTYSHSVFYSSSTRKTPVKTIDSIGWRLPRVDCSNSSHTETDFLLLQKSSRNSKTES